MNHKDVIIVTNSPGELSSWARVITDSLKKKMPDSRIIVVLVPCPYATGKEDEIARSYKAVDVVFTPADFLRFFLLGKTPDNFKFSDKGIVIFLGGDFWHAAGLAWRTKFPAVAYTARPNSGWNSYFKYFFCPDERIRHGLLKLGVPDSKIRIVGNLIVEGVKPECSREEGLSRWNLDPDKPIIGILPGSRLYHMQDSLPVFLQVVEEVKQAEPDVQFILGLSPFLDIEEVKKTLDSPESPIGGVGGSIANSGGSLKILTQGGVQILIMQSMQHDLMNMVDMILTIPGTNTAECAFMGTPMVVVASWKARIPSGGLGFIMNAIPICGLRKKMYEKVLQRIKYISLPNTIAQKDIVPEVIVDEEASEVTGVVLDLIRDKSRMHRISGELKEAMGEAGAAAKITDIVIEILNGSES